MLPIHSYCRVLALLVVFAGWLDAAEGGPPKTLLGYINQVPPESPQARRDRHEQVARRRQGVPVIVHRGARKVAPENTLEAYAGAMDLGADGVEIDIRRSRDGVLYLFHDDTLERCTRGTGRVGELTYFQLLSITPKEVYGTATSQTRPPTLAALLTLARQRASLLHLDVKEPGLEDAIEKLIEAADVWDHIVEVNERNAQRLRTHPKVRLIPYKGWAPHEDEPEQLPALRSWLPGPGQMLICTDPRLVVEALGRKPLKPLPLPEGLRIPWTPAGPVTSRPAATSSGSATAPEG